MYRLCNYYNNRFRYSSLLHCNMTILDLG
jgi:hypothetical protein